MKVPNFTKLAAAAAAKFLAKTINAKNWIQGEEDNGEGQYCMIGFIDHVDQGLEEELRAAVRAVLPKGNSIEGYNDKDGRKVSEIKAIFAKAGDRLAKEAGQGVAA